MKIWGKSLAPNRLVMDYVDLLVNEKDIIALAKSGKLNSDRSKFLLENSAEFAKVMQIVAVQEIYKESKKKKIQDSQFVYVTGVIKDPRAQAAKNGPEYEMEKQVFREMFLYSNWELWKKPGTLYTLVNLMFNGFDKSKK
jgi:hypothetical protein